MKDVFGDWFKKEFENKKARPVVIRTQCSQYELEKEESYPRFITCCVCKMITYGPPPVLNEEVMRFDHIDAEEFVKVEDRWFIIPHKHAKCKELFEEAPFAYYADENPNPYSAFDGFRALFS